MKSSNLVLKKIRINLANLTFGLLPIGLFTKSQYLHFSIKNLRWFFIFLLKIHCFSNVFGQSPLPLDPRTCGDPCTANDVRVIGAELFVDEDGTIPLYPGCTIGYSVSAYLCVKYINNTSSNRGVLAITADITSPGQPNQLLNYCPADVLGPNETAVFCVPTAISWVCGNSLTLRNIFTAWTPVPGSANPVLPIPDDCPTSDNCNFFPSGKCRYDQEITVVVTTPLIANFLSACGTEVNSVQFTAEDLTNTIIGVTTGGTGPLTYEWQFGSPTILGTSTDPNPSFTFPNNGSFDVILTVNDASIPAQVSTTTKTVNIAALGCCTPAITTCPPNASFECDADLSAWLADYEVENCGGNTIVENDFDRNDFTGCNQTGTRTITFILKNATNGVELDRCTASLTIEDTGKPMISCPPNAIVDCAVANPQTGVATATDACDGSVDLTSSDATIAANCTGRAGISRTWTATDDCGNTSACVQIITYKDDTKPTITCPANAVLDCSAPNPSTGVATATDACDGSVDLTSSDATIAANCTGKAGISRTWTATDDCGNTSACVQIITYKDDTKPTITCPANAILVCTAPNPPVGTGTATAIDLCNNMVDITSSDAAIAANCTGRAGISRTWKATDKCGNTSACIQTITFKDETGPTGTCPVLAYTVDCIDDLPCAGVTSPELTTAINGIKASFTDNCGGVVTVVADGNSVSGCVNNVVTLILYFKVKDACGNFSANRCEVKFTAPCDPFCTFTQGFWGNTGKHNGVSAPTIIAGLLLANGSIVIGLPGRSATIKTAKCVTMLLPSGGTPGQLASGNAVYMTCNNQTVGLNVLASQTIALQLNLWFNLQNGLNLGLYDLTDGCLNVPLPAGVITVNDLLALSNQVLGGCGCASASQVNNVINAINNYWDECQLSICSGVNLLTSSERTEDEVKNIDKAETLLITPNPASEMVSIDVSLFLDKKVEIVVFNVLGEMVWKKGITKVENELIQVPLGQFEEGIYPIILRDEANGKVYTARIVVQK
jgi:hypothetical protein